MHRHLHYDGESRTSYVANAIHFLATAIAIISFLGLWPGGPFDSVLELLEKHTGVTPFIWWFALPCLVWLVVLMVGYTFRQLAAFMAGAFYSAFAVATVVTLTLFVSRSPTVAKIAEFIGISNSLTLAAVWIILFVGVMLVVAHFFRSRGYYYD